MKIHSFIILTSVLLSACTADTIKDTYNAGSGAVHGAIDQAGDIVDSVEESIDEVNERLQKIQSGASLIKEGAGELQEAVW